MRPANGPVFFLDLHFFNIGPPHAVGPAGNLAAGNADLMPGLDTFFTYFTFSHFYSSNVYYTNSNFITGGF